MIDYVFNILLKNINHYLQILKKELNNWLRIKILKIELFAINRISIEYNSNRMNNKKIYLHNKIISICINN